MTMSVSRDFHMLGKITTGKEVEQLDCLSIAEVVDMDRGPLLPDIIRSDLPDVENNHTRPELVLYIIDDLSFTICKSPTTKEMCSH